MLALLRAKADAQGRFTPESVWQAWKDWEFGQKKIPSRWLTLLALRALGRMDMCSRWTSATGLPKQGIQMTLLAGLSDAQALALRQQGLGNTFQTATSRSYRDIIASNVLNPINLLLFAIGAVMVAIGRTSDAITSAGLILLNVVIGLYQEIRAKRQLDRIALLTRPRVAVRRAGQESSIDPAEIVQGDLVVASEGDQLVADGVIVEGRIEADESALSGESDAVGKTAGDQVLSGSFVLSGSALYEVTRVGGESFANKLTATARQYELSHTPMQREISLLLKLLTFSPGSSAGRR